MLLQTTTRPIFIQFLGHGCMDDLTIERSFDSQATWVFGFLGLFFDILSMGFHSTKHWQTSKGDIQTGTLKGN